MTMLLTEERARNAANVACRDHGARGQSVLLRTRALDTQLTYLAARPKSPGTTNCPQDPPGHADLEFSTYGTMRGLFM